MQYHQALYGVLLAISPGLVQGATFTPLAPLPYADEPIASYAFNISGDGQTIIGSSSVDIPDAQFAVRWALPSLEPEDIGLPDMVDGEEYQIHDLSYDGSVIVGALRTIHDPRLLDPLATRQQVPQQWTRSEGFQALPLPEGSTTGLARLISGNGEVVVIVDTTISKTLRWTSSSGFEEIALPGTETNYLGAGITDMTTDGRILVGVARSDMGDEAFRWTIDGETELLGSLVGGSTDSWALSVSADGSSIVGLSRSELSPSSGEAFYWTQENGMQGLGVLAPADTNSSAELVSADGSVVLGYSQNAFVPRDRRYFVWTQETGMRNFEDVLAGEYNLADELLGWTNLRVEGLSDDALSIVGNGVNPEGQLQGWLVQLDHPIGIPEPSSIALALAAIGTLGITRMRATSTWSVKRFLLSPFRLRYRIGPTPLS